MQALAVTTAVEALAQEARARLLEDDDEHREHSKEERKELLQALADSPLKEHAAYERLRQLIGSAWGQRSSTDVLRALCEGSSPLLTEEELRAWKRLRNPLAHGRFHTDQHDGSATMYRRLFLSQNLINKLTLALCGYEGVFRDYAQTGWPVVPFWRSGEPTGEAGIIDGNAQELTHSGDNQLLRDQAALDG